MTPLVYPPCNAPTSIARGIYQTTKFLRSTPTTVSTEKNKTGKYTTQNSLKSKDPHAISIQSVMLSRYLSDFT